MNDRLLHTLAVTLMLAGMTACSSDEPTNSGGQTPTPAPAASTLTMTIVADQAESGSGTAAQPFTASHSQPLNVILSQTVTYSDAQGQQQTVNPKAVITATVKDDTIHAADLAALTKLTEPSPKTDVKTGNPQTATRQQLFDIGGQQITFDLSHEIYSYTLNDKQTELPYVELRAPKYGAATPDKNSSTRSVQGFGQMPVASVTAIRLTPIATATRGTTVRDTTMYDVAVSFTVDAVPHNTSNSTTQTLSVEIHYTGVVESTTEIPNASTSIAYQLNYHDGTSDTSSPFRFTAEEPLQLEWLADARCTYTAMEDLSTRVVTMEPRASITVSVKSNTVRWDGDKDGLTAVSSTEPTITTSGNQPQVTDCMQTFNIGGQAVTINWKYEDYGSVEVEDTTIAMPYLQLGAPEVVELTVAETAQSREAKSRLTGKTYTLREGQTRADGDSDIDNLQGGVAKYEVTVRFRQQLQGINTKEPVEEAIEYVVTYIAEVGIKLISTIYEKEYVWAEPEYNLDWRYAFIIKRIRTYSTGEQEIDTFVAPTAWIIDLSVRISPNNVMDFIAYHNETPDPQNDYFRLVYSTQTGVPDISNISWEIFDEGDGWNERNLSDYTMVHYTTKFDPKNPVEYWYHHEMRRWRRIDINYDNPEGKSGWVAREEIYINYVDVFLYLDGQVIDFSEYRMTYDFHVRVENTTFEGLPAKKITHECKAKYLGKDFYLAAIDTVYQIK